MCLTANFIFIWTEVFLVFDSLFRFLCNVLFNTFEASLHINNKRCDDCGLCFVFDRLCRILCVLLKVNLEK